eukprot:680406-Alexandrium_andersonii.AAC.1
MSASLVGSEMCIRDSLSSVREHAFANGTAADLSFPQKEQVDHVGGRPNKYKCPQPRGEGLTSQG